MAARPDGRMAPMMAAVEFCHFFWCQNVICTDSHPASDEMMTCNEMRLMIWIWIFVKYVRMNTSVRYYQYRRYHQYHYYHRYYICYYHLYCNCYHHHHHHHHHPRRRRRRRRRRCCCCCFQTIGITLSRDSIQPVLQRTHFR